MRPDNPMATEEHISESELETRDGGTLLINFRLPRRSRSPGIQRRPAVAGELFKASRACAEFSREEVQGDTFDIERELHP